MTKLVLIETQDMVAYAYDGKIRSKKAILPSPEELTHANSLIVELNAFRKTARADQPLDEAVTAEE